MKRSIEKSKVQREGNYDAARGFDKAEREFVRSGKVKPGMRRAPPDSADEAAQMREAERIGKSHSRGEAPVDADAQGNRSGDA